MLGHSETDVFWPFILIWLQLDYLKSFIRVALKIVAGFWFQHPFDLGKKVSKSDNDIGKAAKIITDQESMLNGFLLKQPQVKWQKTWQERVTTRVLKGGSQNNDHIPSLNIYSEIKEGI